MDIIKSQKTIFFNNHIEICKRKVSAYRSGGVSFSGLTFNAKSKIPIFSDEEIGNMIITFLNSDYKKKLGELSAFIQKTTYATNEFGKYIDSYMELLTSISPLLRLFAENLFVEEYIYHTINNCDNGYNSKTLNELNMYVNKSLSYFAKYLNINEYFEPFIANYVKSMLRTTISPITKLLKSLELLKQALEKDEDKPLPDLMLLEKIGWLVQKTAPELLDSYTDFIPYLFTYNSRKPILAEEDSEQSYIYSYNINRFENLIFVLLYHTLEGRILIRSCACCGRMFVAKRPNNIYCDGVDPESGKQCAKYGPHKPKHKMSEFDIIYEKIKENHRIYLFRNIKTEKENLKDISETYWRKINEDGKRKYKRAADKCLKDFNITVSDIPINEKIQEFEEKLREICKEYSNIKYIYAGLDKLNKEKR